MPSLTAGVMGGCSSPDPGSPRCPAMGRWGTRAEALGALGPPTAPVPPPAPPCALEEPSPPGFPDRHQVGRWGQNSERGPVLSVTICGLKRVNELTTERVFSFLFTVVFFQGKWGEGWQLRQLCQRFEDFFLSQIVQGAGGSTFYCFLACLEHPDDARNVYIDFCYWQFGNVVIEDPPCPPPPPFLRGSSRP